MGLPDLSRLFVNGFNGEVIEVSGADVVRGGKEAARVAPKSTAAGETLRDCFLALFVEILTEVAGCVHIPRHEVWAFQLGVVFPSGLSGVEVPNKMFRAVRLGDPVP